MTPSQLDKQEADRQKTVDSYVPAYDTAKSTTDYNTYNKLLQEALNYINAKYPNGVPGSNPVQPLAYYDKDKDDYVVLRNYMSGGRDDKLDAAIKTLENYKTGIAHAIKETYFPKAAAKDESNISKRISKQVAKDTKGLELNTTVQDKNISDAMSADNSNYNNVISITEDMTKYFIAAMQLVQLPNKQKETEAYYNAYLNYKNRLNQYIGDNSDLRYISDYYFTNKVQEKGSGILSTETIIAQRKWLNENKQQYTSKVSTYTSSADPNSLNTKHVADVKQTLDDYFNSATDTSAGGGGVKE